MKSPSLATDTQIHDLEVMLSGERGQKEIWMARASEWSDRYHELEAAMHTTVGAPSLATDAGAVTAEKFASLFDFHTDYLSRGERFLSVHAARAFAEAFLAAAHPEQRMSDAAIRPVKSHCQNGGDVCLAGNRDGVCCPEDSCDIDDGTRKNPIDTAREPKRMTLGREGIDRSIVAGVRANAARDVEWIANRFLKEEDSAALFAFHSQCEDGDGYTETAEAMVRLAELGVVQRFVGGRGKRYGTTAFGAWIIEAQFHQNPLWPLRTADEHNARESAGHALYLKQSTPQSTAWVELDRDTRESWRRNAEIERQGGEA